MSTQLGFNYNYFKPLAPIASSQGTVMARVDRIILGPLDADGVPDQSFNLNGKWASVGAIEYTVMTGNQATEDTGKDKLVAYPYFPNYKQYPVIGEIVQIVTGPSTDLNSTTSATTQYYLPPFNVWNSIHHNAFPNLIKYSTYVSTESTAATAPNSTTYPLGQTFKEKGNLKNLQPYEGDIIMEGRWGQSIRFGSTVKSKGTPNPWSSGRESANGDPIILIRNKQGKQAVKEAWISGIEDINNDGASIYLCSGQAIYIQDLNNFSLTSFTSGKKLTEENIQERRRQPVSTDTVSPKEQSEFELKSNK